MFEDVLGKVSLAAYHMQKTNTPNAMFFAESFKPNQIQCKKWLVEEILNTSMNLDRVLVLGSWNSVLLYELFKHYGSVNWFDFLDIDPTVHLHRDRYFEINHMEKNYSSVVMDATEFSDYEGYDLVINTSCEHMKDIPAVHGPLYAIQSNDYVSVPDHINCVKSTKQLASQNNITEILYQGTRNMGHYNRFMVIGSYW